LIDARNTNHPFALSPSKGCTSSSQEAQGFDKLSPDG
jgi:hypothetical protein